MEEINFTEPQLRAVESIKSQALTRGMYIGVGLVVITIIGITSAVCLVNKYSHLIYL